MRPLLWLLLAGLLACGPPEARESTPAAKAPPAPPLDPATLGSIQGQVNFEGPKPVRAEISMDATPACARQHKGPILSEEVVLNPNGTLKNVIVRVSQGLPERAWPVPDAPARLDQKGCLYSPHAVALMAGQRLEIYNSDPTNHNVHPIPAVNPEWNESQPPLGEVKVKTFPKPEASPVVFKCNVHPWMRAWVAVDSHPFHAVSGDDGSFRIDGLPAGEYTVEAWHEKYGSREVKVKVEARKTAVAGFTFRG